MECHTMSIELSTKEDDQNRRGRSQVTAQENFFVSFVTNFE